MTINADNLLFIACCLLKIILKILYCVGTLFHSVLTSLVNKARHNCMGGQY